MVTMVEDKKTPDASDGVKPQDAKNVAKEGWLVRAGRTIVSFVAVIVILVLAYYVITYLMGSNYNLDTLLTGSKTTPLPTLP